MYGQEFTSIVFVGIDICVLSTLLNKTVRPWDLKNQLGYELDCILNVE